MAFPLKSSCHMSEKGITLFEMMIVMTVTLILSLIFIYSTSHIVVRTKMERVKEEHRVLSRALQNYRMDYNDYPMQMTALNAPTAYLSCLPRDPFLPHSTLPTYEYHYKPSDEYEYIIISAGPDGDLDLDQILDKVQSSSSSDGGAGSGSVRTRDELLKTILPIYLATKVYDPTNGAVSDGDIITFMRR
jgi:type II secretory pathway pseudopilin PulG